jgi:hypothetical protein
VGAVLLHQMRQAPVALQKLQLLGPAPAGTVGGCLLFLLLQLLARLVLPQLRPIHIDSSQQPADPLLLLLLLL